MSGRNSPGENKSKPVEASGEAKTSKTLDETEPSSIKSSVTVTPPQLAGEIEQDEPINKDKVHDRDQAQ